MLRRKQGPGRDGGALPTSAKEHGSSRPSCSAWVVGLLVLAVVGVPASFLVYSVVSVSQGSPTHLSSSELLTYGAMDAASRMRSLAARLRRKGGAPALDASALDRPHPRSIPLVDDALPSEGIRLEMVTTPADLNPYPTTTFCREFEDSDTLMARAIVGGSHHPSPARCAIVRFWLVDQETPNSDKIIDYIHAHEFWVVELFTGILSATACLPLKNGVTYFCRADIDDALVNGRRQLVADWGANAGYFSQMAARMGYSVIAVEPQPHCVEFIRAATAMNDMGDSVELHHAFLARGGHTKDGSTSMTIAARNGCFGTFPIPEEKKVRAYYDSLPGGKWSRVTGGNATVTVGVLDPAGLISEDDLVPLLKIDVEGQEVDVLYALEPHLRAGRILNLMVELNKRSYDPNIEGHFEASFPIFKAVLRFLRDLNYVTMCAQSSPTLSWGDSPVIFDDASIEHFVEDGWMTANIWVALQKGKATAPVSNSLRG